MKLLLVAVALAAQLSLPVAHLAFVSILSEIAVSPQSQPATTETAKFHLSALAVSDLYRVYCSPLRKKLPSHQISHIFFFSCYSASCKFSTDSKYKKYNNLNRHNCGSNWCACQNRNKNTNRRTGNRQYRSAYRNTAEILKNTHCRNCRKNDKR